MNRRILLKGYVQYSPLTFDKQLYWRAGQIILTSDSLSIVRGSSLLTSLPYTQIYSINRYPDLENNLIGLKYVNIERTFDELYLVSSPRIIENVYSVLDNVVMNSKIGQRGNNPGPDSTEAKIIYMLYKKIPFEMIAYLLGITKRELVKRLNLLKNRGLIDSRGTPTKKGLGLLKQLFRQLKDRI